MILTVGILGCGPSGLVAANAVETAGLMPIIISKPRKSYIAGAQYSHEPIAGIHDSERPDTKIQVRKVGTQSGYAEKVYGRPDAPVSWSRYQPGEHSAWNLRSAYEALWARYADWIIPKEVTPAQGEQVATQGILGGIGPSGLGGLKPTAWISTIPLSSLCRSLSPFGTHGFTMQAVHILQDENAKPSEPSFIEYNGEKNPAWYRRSVIFGTEALEWSAETMRKKPPIEGVVTIEKPLATNCDCFAKTEAPFMLAGRYGRWEKSELINDVQRNTFRFMEYLKENY